MRKVSKTGIVLVGSMILCIIMALAIGVPSGFSAATAAVTMI